MTQIVILDAAPPAGTFDESLVFARQLPASSISALYAALQAPINLDPQETLGWEEVYGPDHPLTAGDVPVITNGICRVRYLAAYSAFAVDFYRPGIGWLEQGRVSVWHDDGGTITQHGNLISSQVLSWTPERAVIVVTTTAVAGGQTYRMETYITVQRGWTGPRFECYPSPNAAGNAVGAHVRFAPVSGIDDFIYAHGAAKAMWHSFVSATWPSATPDDWTAANAEPWVALLGGIQSVGLIPTRIGDRARRYDDTAGYGAVRKAIAVCADYGTAQAGYVSALLAFGPEAPIPEAEAMRDPANGLIGVSADATASGGNAQGSGGTIVSYAMIGTAAQWGLKAGKYGFWFRMRVGTAGATASVSLVINGTTVATVTTTSTTYVWVYAGEFAIANPAHTVNVTLARTVGTGVAYLDRAAVLPYEQRTAQPDGTLAAFDGVRDAAAAHLYDARNVPTLVAR